MCSEADEGMREKVDYFSDEGLRTLIYGKRELTEEEYLRWAKDLHVNAIRYRYGANVCL